MTPAEQIFDGTIGYPALQRKIVMQVIGFVAGLLLSFGLPPDPSTTVLSFLFLLALAAGLSALWSP